MTLLDASETQDVPKAFLRKLGELHAQFDERTQDSGNVSYGIQVDGLRYFVKTAGAPTSPAFLGHEQRVSWLRNAIRVSEAVKDPSVPHLRNVIESPHGPLLVYDWVPGELVGVPRERRSDPRSAFQRFKSLPLSELAEALTSVFRVHAALAARGWIASDFYDGAMMYEFGTRRLSLVDLDMYRSAPFTNDVGRMFGSTRFMAPEEFDRGATIDDRTTVFTMGRCIQVFLDREPPERDSRAHRSFLSIAESACRTKPSDRWSSTEEFYAAWLQAKVHLDPAGGPTPRCTSRGKKAST